MKSKIYRRATAVGPTTRKTSKFSLPRLLISHFAPGGTLKTQRAQPIAVQTHDKRVAFVAMGDNLGRLYALRHHRRLWRK